MANTTTIKDGAGTDRLIASRDISATVRSPVFDQDNAASPTYRAAGSAFAQVATPTVSFVIKGSATKTVRVKKIRIAGAATAAGSMPAVVAKCSDAGTVGSAVLTAITAVPLDSNDAAATGVVSTVGTANYTTPPAVIGTIGSGRLCMTALGTGVGVQPLDFDFTQHAVVLRGILESVTIAFNGAAIPSGGVIDYTVEWVEDAS
jgi:hypothetical protein